MRPLVAYYYYLFITEYISLVLHIVLENIFSSLRSSILGVGLSTLAYASNITGPSTITMLKTVIKKCSAMFFPPYCYLHFLQNIIPVVNIPISPTSNTTRLVFGLSISYCIKPIPKLQIPPNMMHKINNSFFIFTSCHLAYAC